MSRSLDMSDQFVVVAGSPRSGTSLLRTILAGSNQLCVHKTEPHYLLELHRRFGDVIADVPKAVEFLLAHEKFPADEIAADELRSAVAGRTSVTLSELLVATYRLLNKAHPSRAVVLKHPAFILHLDLIKNLLPNLVVIHCIRDPRANVHSQRTRWPATSMWEAASKWRASIRAGRRWQQRGVTPYLEVRYEDLVTAPKATCRTLCEFLRIPFEPSLLAFDHVEREWNPARPGEGSKRHYQGFEHHRIDNWKKFMTPAEIKLIEDRCHEGMKLFGYALTTPPVNAREYVPYYVRERRKALKRSIRRLKRSVRRGAAAW
jgi:hypothetical protein